MNSNPSTVPLRIQVLLLSILCLLLARPALAVQLEFVGVTGNSGAMGQTLVRAEWGRRGGGVAVDGQGRIYTGGGDRILVLNRDGKQLWQNRLPEPGWVVGGPTFVIAGEYLYFLAGKPIAFPTRWWQFEWQMVEPNLCRVALHPDATAEVQVTSDKFKDYTSGDIVLTASAGQFGLFVGYSTTGDKYSIFKVAGSELKLLFTAPVSGGRACIDEQGNFYLGGNRSVHKFDSSGQAVPTFTPRPLADLGSAWPTAYMGTLMLTRDAIWDAAGLGILGRYSRDYKPDPGTVARSVVPFNDVAQIVDGPDGDYYVRSADAVYEARLMGGDLKPQRRLGALPHVLGLALTGNGYVGAGYEDFMLWWDFDNVDPAAAPVRGQYSGPVAQGFAAGDESWISIAGSGWPIAYNPRAKTITIGKYTPEASGGFDTFNTRLSDGTVDPPPSAVAQVGNYYFVIDRGTHGLLQSPVGDHLAFHTVPMKEFGDENNHIASLCAVGANSLALTAGNTLALYRVAKEGTLELTWTMRGGAGTNDDFGQELYVASSGNQLIVTDTSRHRVVLFSLGDNLDKPPAVMAQFGVTDQPGDDASHLHTPTLIAIQGGNAVVYDSANCRIVKLRLR